MTFRLRGFDKRVVGHQKRVEFGSVELVAARRGCYCGVSPVRIYGSVANGANCEAGDAMNEELRQEIWDFVDQNRARALWWMRPDYYPQTPADARDVLRRIAARGDRNLFVRAMTLSRRIEV